jgi:hypothetical protein
MPTRRVLVLLAILLVLGGVTSSCARQASSASLTAQDYIDIQQLYAAYNNAFDGGNAEAYAQLFTPDRMFNDLAGRGALVASVKRQHVSTQRHWNSNLNDHGHARRREWLSISTSYRHRRETASDGHGGGVHRHIGEDR